MAKQTLPRCHSKRRAFVPKSRVKVHSQSCQCCRLRIVVTRARLEQRKHAEARSKRGYTCAAIHIPRIQEQISHVPHDFPP